MAKAVTTASQGERKVGELETNTTERLSLAGLLHVNLDTPNGVAKATVYGDLDFEQAAPILIDSIPRTLYKDSPLDTDMFEKHGLNGILDFYEARNDKLRFNY